LLDEQRARWAERWADVDVTFEGGPELERVMRFVVLHLLAAGPTGTGTVGDGPPRRSRPT
jgi:trehalose/maltose hydrolase-like predicted phosphorylase